MEIEFREKMKTIAVDKGNANVRQGAREDLPDLLEKARINPVVTKFAPKEGWAALLMGRTGWFGLRAVVAPGAASSTAAPGARPPSSSFFIFLAMYNYKYAVIDCTKMQVPAAPREPGQPMAPPLFPFPL